MTHPRRASTLVKRPTPKWIWLAVLLGALLIAGLLWLLLTRGDDGRTPAQSASPSAAAGQSPGASGAQPDGSGGLGDLAAIVDAPNPGSLVGNRVNLTDVEVQSVIGDTTFWVGSSPEQQVLVVLEEDESGGPIEGGVDVEAGQTVTLRGVVREMPSVEDAIRRWQLSEEDAAGLEGLDVFIRAQRVDVNE